MESNNKLVFHLSLISIFVLINLHIDNAFADFKDSIRQKLSTVSTGPLMPKSIEECINYRSYTDKKYREIDQAHQLCLDNSKAPVVNVYRSDGKLLENKCSKSPCQQLHEARLSMSELKSLNMKKCYSDVAEYQKNNKKDEKIFKIKIDNEIARDIFEKHIKNRSGDLLISTIDLDEMKKSCKTAVSIVKQSECIDALHQYASISRNLSQPNLIIKLIQKSSAQDIKKIQKSTLKQGTLALQGTNHTSVDCDLIGTQEGIDSIEINTEEDELSKQISYCK